MNNNKMTQQLKERLAKDALKAMRMAVRSVFEDHEQSGDPVYFLENGKLVRRVLKKGRARNAR